MWKRFAETLICIQCEQNLELLPIDEENLKLSSEHISKGERLGISQSELSEFVETGLLICPICKLWFPILHGLPVMLPYASRLHEEFIHLYGAQVNKIGPEYSPPNKKSVIGEEYVLKSFSKEWLEYSYDDVLWTWTYKERERIFLSEIGVKPSASAPLKFLEIGCGLGIVTSFGEKHFAGDAVGVDLSLAPLSAVKHFRENPFLHFVESSLWQLPLPKKYFDLVYSHGVLHHTFSTEKAFKTISQFCKPHGRMYIWVYGALSINESLARRIAYSVEVLMRPLLARLPYWMTNVILSPIACVYIVINRFQKMMGERRQSYNFSRAMHAARDRLTPLFAHRASSDEVISWFQQEGFDDIQKLSELEIASGLREDFRRNVGVRGRRIL